MTTVETKAEVWELPIGEHVSIKATIHENPLRLTRESLFSLGFRYNNSKRSFMFVSKVLGKHTPINPLVLTQMTENLAKVYYSGNKTDKKTLIIGFAEAATAMAQCFSDAVEGDVSYVHSTRETPEGVIPLFSFKEAHSHAPCHNFYLEDETLLTEAEEIILVDDEVTSGRTALGVIEEINKLYPGKTFGMASFLDWREDEHKESFNKLVKDGVTIKCKSLIEGHIGLDKVEIPKNKEMPVYSEAKGYTTKNWTKYTIDLPKLETATTSFISHSGRFGLSSIDKKSLNNLIIENCKDIKCWLPKGRSLFLGTGELLYIPLKLAETLGESVSFQSVTRTPNLPLKENNYEIRNIDVFPSTLDPTRNEFIYNMECDNFDNVVLFLESSWPEERLIPMLSVIEKKGFKSCSLVFLCE